jgi:hypothetical protein
VAWVARFQTGAKTPHSGSVHGIRSPVAYGLHRGWNWDHRENHAGSIAFKDLDRSGRDRLLFPDRDVSGRVAVVINQVKFLLAALPKE